MTNVLVKSEFSNLYRNFTYSLMSSISDDAYCWLLPLQSKKATEIAGVLEIVSEEHSALYYLNTIMEQNLSMNLQLSSVTQSNSSTARAILARPVTLQLAIESYPHGQLHVFYLSARMARANQACLLVNLFASYSSI